MAEGYFMFYLEASIVCILIFGILLINDRLSFNKQEKQVAFDHALIAHVLYFISDVIWAGIISGHIARIRTAVVIVNFTNFILLSAIAYEWARFASVSEKTHIRDTKRGRLLFGLPWIVMTVVIIVAYICAPTFWVSVDGELNMWYYPLFLIAPLIYVFGSSVCSIVYARRAVDPSDRTLYLMIGLYPLAIVVFGVLQLFWLNAPLFCFGCTLMMLFFYIRSMEDQISLDSLTKLNNRGQLFRYAAQERGKYREGLKTFVIMTDADNFKHVNDTYGHAEGDRALTLVGEVLKCCAKDVPNAPFLSRYGGDEFVAIVRVEDRTEVLQLLGRISARFKEVCESNKLPYELSVSFGFDEWNVMQDSFQECLQRADAKLYTEKRRKQSVGT